MTRSFLWSFLVVVFLLACQANEKTEIDQVLKQREEAFEKRDLSLYLSAISPSYQDGNEDFDRLKGRIARYFKTFDRITYSSWDRTIEREKGNARVVQQYYIEVERGGKKDRSSGKEALFLRKEGGGWKIIKGL